MLLLHFSYTVTLVPWPGLKGRREGGGEDIRGWGWREEGKKGSREEGGLTAIYHPSRSRYRPRPEYTVMFVKLKSRSWSAVQNQLFSI